jgi:uncharacterized cupin superfamily protein
MPHGRDRNLAGLDKLRYRFVSDRNRGFSTMNRSALTVSGAALAAILASIASAAATECSFYNVETSGSLEGGCSVDYEGEGEVIRIGNTKFVFVESGRQGQWSVGSLNGKPAVRYEINRDAYSYSTLDLTLFLDRSEP